MFNKKLYKIITILSIFILLLPEFSFALQSFDEQNLGGFAQSQIIKVPESFEELEQMGKMFLKAVKEKLLSNIEKIWQEEVLPMWRKMYGWVKNVWEKYVWPWLETIWQKILSLFGKEIETRKPIIEEEFEKEKEELKEELPQVKQSLWERFKELIK